MSMCNTELQKGARMKNYQGSFVKLSIFATAFMLRSSAAITLSDGEVKRLKFGNDDNRINKNFSDLPAGIGHIDYFKYKYWNPAIERSTRGPLLPVSRYILLTV